MKSPWFMLPFIAIAIAAVACSSASADRDTKSETRVTSALDAPDGRSFSLEGPRFIEPGEDVVYTVRLGNGTSAGSGSGVGLWVGEYCLALADETGVVHEFGTRDFTVARSVSFERPFELKLPSSITEGTYNLRVVIPGLGTITVATNVGQDVPGSNATFADISANDSCPQV